VGKNSCPARGLPFKRAKMSPFVPSFESLPPPSPLLRASVVVPARDEECGVTRALDALAHSCDHLGRRLDPHTWEVLLLCNNCRDDTARVARQWSARRPDVALHVVEGWFDKGEANIGTVRRALMDAACARLESLAGAALPRLIASTDADTRVARDWLWENARAIEAGAEAVGGRILVEPDGDRQTRRTYLFDTAYRLFAARLESALDPQHFDPWPRHFQFFGASLSLTPRAYRKVGGIPSVPCLEDMALERELVRADVPIRHSPRVRAFTSARHNGRVACGLSSQLRQWNELESEEKLWLVPSGEEIAFKARTRHQLFLAFQDKAQTPVVADALGICPLELRDQLNAATRFGALWEDVWNAAPVRANWRPVPVGVALEQIRALLADII